MTISSHLPPTTNHRAYGPEPRQTSEEYEAGRRMARAWLATEDGQRWRERSPGHASLLGIALRTLADRHGHDFRCGFTDVATAAATSTRGTRHDTRRVERLTVGLSAEEDAALRTLREFDGVAASARVRAMLLVYRTDPEFRRRVDQAASSQQ